MKFEVFKNAAFLRANLLKMGVICSCETLVSTYNSTRRCTTKKTNIDFFIAWEPRISYDIEDPFLARHKKTYAGRDWKKKCNVRLIPHEAQVRGRMANSSACLIVGFASKRVNAEPSVALVIRSTSLLADSVAWKWPLFCSQPLKWCSKFFSLLALLSLNEMFLTHLTNRESLVWTQWKLLWPKRISNLLENKF